MLRSCYSVDMDFTGQGTDTQRVRWFFCDPDAKNMPFPTCFASGNWASERANWDGPGEVLSSDRPWANGSNYSDNTGVFPPVGTPEQFLYGIGATPDSPFPPPTGSQLSLAFPPVTCQLVMAGFYQWDDTFFIIAQVPLDVRRGRIGKVTISPDPVFAFPDFLITYDLSGAAPVITLTDPIDGVVFLPVISFNPSGGDWGTVQYNRPLFGQVDPTANFGCHFLVVPG